MDDRFMLRKKKAMAALRGIYSDTSVSPKRTLEFFEELIEELGVWTEGLEVTIESMEAAALEMTKDVLQEAMDGQ